MPWVRNVPGLGKAQHHPAKKPGFQGGRAHVLSVLCFQYDQEEKQRTVLREGQKCQA